MFITVIVGICYNVLEKKRWVIIVKVNWQLFNNNELVVNLLNKECEYIKNNYLKINEEETINIVDIKNKLYKRITNDYNMEIDFVNNICTFILDNNEKWSINIECNIEIIKNTIIINYQIDDDKRKILIILKEE